LLDILFMPYHVLADLVLLLHLGFVLFVLLGGLLVLKWPRAMWVHLPAAAWGAVVEFSGWVCPLTPLENWFRAQAGQAGYDGDFLAQHLLPILYPTGLTREVQLVLGISVVVVNGVIYGWLWRRRLVADNL
jgi:hypothetical protein